MALARVKVWVASEVLTAADLNGEFNNILNSALALISPLTGNLDVDGQDLLDADELEFRDAAANATAAGRLRRNGANLTWHNGTAASTIDTGALTPKSIQVLSTTGTWTRPTSIRKVVVELVGGGGGSGGSAANGAGDCAAGGGGSAGGYAMKLINVSSTISSATITVGAGGAGGAAGANAGSTGTATIWSDGTNTVTGNGGGAGQGGANSAAVRTGALASGAGGTATGGDVNMTGGYGGVGLIAGGSNIAIGGSGGASILGTSVNGAGQNSTAGVAGNSYGGGAAGGSGTNNAGASAGGAGANGVVIVMEYE